MLPETSRTPKFDFFISFGSEAVTVARAAYSALSARGLATFLSERILPRRSLGDEELAADLGDALLASNALLVIWGQAHRGSRWCQWEVEYFRRNVPDRPIYVLAADATELPRSLAADGRVTLLRRIAEFPDAVRVGAFSRPHRRRSPWTAGPLLLFRPRAWLEAARAEFASFAAIDAILDARRPGADDRAQEVAAWTASSLIGCTVINLLALGIASMCSLGMGVPLWRDLLVCAAVTILGGLLLALGHGVVGGCAGIALGGVVGYGATIVAAALDGNGGAGAAAAAGAFVSGAAAYRMKVAPRVGIETPAPPSALGSAVVLYCVGWAVAAACVRAGTGFRQLSANLAGWQDWWVVSRVQRAAFGAVLGALAGGGCAASLRQRIAFRVRPREQARSGWIAALGLVGASAVVGALACLPDGMRTSSWNVDAIGIGLLVALLAVMFYVLPTVPVGLRTPDGVKAVWGFLGFLFLTAFSQRYLAEFRGLDTTRQALTWMHEHPFVRLVCADRLSFYALAGSLCLFALLTAPGAWRSLKTVHRRDAAAAAASAGLHVVLAVLVVTVTGPVKAPAQPHGPAARIMVQVLEGRGLGAGMSVSRMTPRDRARTIAALHAADRAEAAREERRDTRRLLRAAPFLAGGVTGALPVQPREIEAGEADDERVLEARLAELAIDDDSRAKGCERDAQGHWTPIVRKISEKAFRVVVPPPHRLSIKGYVDAGARVQVTIENETRRERAASYDCIGRCAIAFSAPSANTVGVFSIAIANQGGQGCVLEGSPSRRIVKCEDEPYGADWNEPWLEITF